MCMSGRSDLAAEVTLYRSPQHSQTLHTMQPQAPPSQCLVCQFLNKPLTQVYNDGYSQMVYILVVLKNDNFFRGGGFQVLAHCFLSSSENADGLGRKYAKGF